MSTRTRVTAEQQVRRDAAVDRGYASGKARVDDLAQLEKDVAKKVYKAALGIELLRLRARVEARGESFPLAELQELRAARQAEAQRLADERMAAEADTAE